MNQEGINLSMNKKIKYFLLFISLSFGVTHNALYAIEESKISAFMQTNIDLATTILRDKKLVKIEKSEKLFVIFVNFHH